MKLYEAYQNVYERLTPKYLSLCDHGVGVCGRELISTVKSIESTLQQIKKCIDIYGSDFEVPNNDSEFPDGSDDLFLGCYYWKWKLKDYYERILYAK